MKITDFKKEDLEKGIMIRRNGWGKDISISFNKNASIFDAYINGIITGDKTDLTLEDIMADDWELIENPTQMWKPQVDETYYSIDNSGIILATNNVEFDMDRRAIELGNCFKTKEKALHMVEKIKIINKLRELSNIDFKDTYGTPHCAIAYDYESKKLTFTTSYYYRVLPFNFYFASVEDCKKAIEIIGEDNLKKYYFDVDEEIQ